VTYSSDVCICFSEVLEDALGCFKSKELVELQECDLGVLNVNGAPSEPPEPAVARGRMRPFCESISTGKKEVLAV
jgi:hypothetical protein